MGILQRTVEEQGSVFHSSRTKQQAEQNQKIIADRRLREEQDAAYLAALQIDKVCKLYIYVWFNMYVLCSELGIIKLTTKLNQHSCPFLGKGATKAFSFSRQSSEASTSP